MKRHRSSQRQRLCMSLLVAAAVLLPSTLPATTFIVDPDHSSVTFRIRHLFTPVTGRFDTFRGRIVFDDKNPRVTKIEGTIVTASINTNSERRDEHLRSKDFFDVAKYPQITFSAEKLTEIDPEARTAKLHGTLSMHGWAHAVILDASFLGMGTGPSGEKRAGFSATTTIDRRDYGLDWNKPTEPGVLDVNAQGLLVGTEVAIEIHVEATAER